jgi:dTDP-4-dehydrorhamnose reductase
VTRFLVTGASGLLGLNLCLEVFLRHEVIGVVNEHGLVGAPFPLHKVDLSQPGQAASLIAEISPDVVIHCAALANLDACESQPDMAKRVNTDLPGKLAEITMRSGIRLVHISTDCVFDGQKGNYTEDDIPTPVGVYALTKVEGERRVMESNPRAVIARVNFYGWSLAHKRSLGEFFFENLAAHQKVKGFTDVFFCPLLVNDLANILVEIAELPLRGIYHVLSQEALSKYDFGCRLAHQFGLDADLIQPSSWKEGGLKAARSPNLTLRTDKLAQALGHPMPRQAEGLDKFQCLYKEGFPERIRSMSGA